MVCWRIFVLLITLVSVSLEARPIHSSENLAPPPASQSNNQIAPSPSSGAATNMNSATNQAPAGQPVGALLSGTCAGASNKCQDDHINMTACFVPAHIGHEGSFLLVLNNGENTLMLNVSVSPSNVTYESIQIPKHDVKQISIIPSKVGGSSSILLDAGIGKCTIHMAPSVWKGYYSLRDYNTYMTPINGVYLLGMTAILIGGICICYKFRKQDRHIDGVAYQELEMGKSEPHDSSMKLETNEGWNESWEDDWDEEKPVKSPVNESWADSFDD